MNNNRYGGIIWTNHAIEQLTSRGIEKDKALQTYKNPDYVYDGKEKETKEFKKTFKNATITVIAKQNEQKEWVVISLWRDPPLPGTLDYKRKQEWLRYKKAGFFEKLFITLKRQIGF